MPSVNERIGLEEKSATESYNEMIHSSQYFDTLYQDLDLNTTLTPVHNLGKLSCFVPPTRDLCMSPTSDVQIKQVSSNMKSLQKVWLLNREKFELLTSEIKKIGISIEKNLGKQAFLEKIIKELNVPPPDKRYVDSRSISVFAAPYFRDCKKEEAPENEDTEIIRKTKDVNTCTKLPRPWIEKEEQQVSCAVKRFLETALPLKKKKKNIKNGLKKKKLTESEAEILQKQLIDVDNKIQFEKERPVDNHLENIKGRIDWVEISSVDMKGMRSPQECENRWNNCLKFSLNKEPFTEEEDVKLRDLVEIYKEREWDLIADKLETNRNAIQCIERYRKKFKKKKFWTKEDDDRLLSLIKEYTFCGVIRWPEVYTEMGLTYKQCTERYFDTLSRQYNHVPFTPEEDAILIVCREVFGLEFGDMKPFMKRKPSKAFSKRYIWQLDPSVKFSRYWSEEEDKHLISLIKKYGYSSWSKICKELPGRSSLKCRVRADHLLKHSIEYHLTKGTKYDIKVYDPKLYAKILRPLSKEQYDDYKYPKIKPRSVREDAIVALLKALGRVGLDFSIEADEMDASVLSWLRFDQSLLHKVCEELNKMIVEAEKQKSPPERKLIYRKPIKRTINEVCDEEFQEVTENLEDENCKTINYPVDTMKKRHSDSIQCFDNRRPDEGRREKAEMSLHKAFLYQNYGCSLALEDEENIQDVTFSGVDYSETVETVVEHFIQPPAYENEYIVLAPNTSTITGMEVMEFKENRLMSIAGCISHSKNYIDYICERRKFSPKCIQCLHKVEEPKRMTESPQKEKNSFQDVICSMKHKQFIISKEMETAAYVEAASNKKCVEVCSCASLEESRNAVQRLRKRFLSLFMWPALLAATNLTEEQNELVCSVVSEQGEEDPIKRKEGNRNTKTRRKKTSSSTKSNSKCKRRKIDEAVSGNNADDCSRNSVSN